MGDTFSNSYAVVSGLEALRSEEVVPALKRYLLLFDGIVVGDEVPGSVGGALKGQPRHEVSWLAEQGLVRPGLLDAKTVVKPAMDRMPAEERDRFVEMLRSSYSAIGALKCDSNEEMVRRLAEDEGYRRQYAEAYGLLARSSSLVLERVEGCTAIPVVGPMAVPSTRDEKSKPNVARVVIQELPIPDDATPWESILDFRQDLDSKRRLVSLQRWMANAAKSDVTERELSLELKELLYQYEQHMELHSIKYRRGVLQTVTTVLGDSLEHLSRFRPGKAASALFAIRDDQVRLLEAEMAAPGREVAYVLQASKRFGGRN